MSYYGRSPLLMHCPRCASYGGHPVIKSDPRWFYWQGTERLFTRLTGRELSYRAHNRRCSKCKHEFQALELASDFFYNVVREVQRLQAVEAGLASKLAEAEQRIDGLREQLQRIADMALSNLAATDDSSDQLQTQE